MVAGIAPVAGFIGSCPDVKIKPLALIPCEYGPIAAGALSVEIIVFIKTPSNYVVQV